jgi:microsomal dipeptidase-like Zn-dependent dipeptidase
MENPFFIDIHTHPEFKTYWSANLEIDRLNCWKKFRMPYLLRIIDLILLGDVLSSQCTLRQLHRNRGLIALAGLISAEKAEITTNIHIRPGIEINLYKIARILKFLGYRKSIDPDLVQRISLPVTYNFDLFKEVQEHLIRSERRGCGYHLLTKISDYNPRKLNIILTIEGGHNLQTQTSGNNAGIDVVDNLRRLKLSGRRYFFMSMAHLEQNLLCTHAYNIKIVTNDKFKPTVPENENGGLTTLGRDVITEALKSQPYRMLIDIKHMSLKARQQYYDMLRQNYRSENIPIIMSHGGVTGVSWNNRLVATFPEVDHEWIKVQHYKCPGLPGTKFYPRSINLYDEEIIKILDSKGVIGLNFDEKILGVKQIGQAHPVEYFSKDDCSCSDFIVSSTGYDGLQEPAERPSTFETRMDSLKEMLIIYLNELYDHPGQYRAVEIRQRLNEIRQDYMQLLTEMAQEGRPELIFNNAIKHLCNNILHIVKIGGQNAWKHICIGSDFDGMINPINVCRNAKKYDNLSNALKEWLLTMANNAAINYYITDIDKQVNDIMSGNAFKFLQDNFR